MLLIASFPRSGNHLVRFFVEYVTGRATLGCRGNPDDLPIVHSFSGDELRHVDVSNPIARKEHYVAEIRDGMTLENYDRMVFIRRRFLPVILSHTRELSGRDRYRALRWSAKRYLRLWWFCRSWSGPKIFIRYERLVSSDGASEIARLFDWLGNDAIPERASEAIRDFHNLRMTYGKSSHPEGHREFVSDIQ